MEEPNYRKILDRKILYYGDTRAASEFAAEEYAREYHEFKMKHPDKLITNFHVVTRDHFEKGIELVIRHRSIKVDRSLKSDFHYALNMEIAKRDIAFFAAEITGFKHHYRFKRTDAPF